MRPAARKTLTTAARRTATRRYGSSFSTSDASKDSNDNPYNAFIDHSDRSTTPRLADSDITPRNESTQGPLSGISIAIKDNICTIDQPTTCASAALKDYTSPFDASAVTSLRRAGAHIVAGKTNMDEFGMGSNSTHTAFGRVRSAFSADSGPEYSAGGSSGGSAVAVASGACDAALGTDTGGSVRLPASYNGVYGFKPSYGRISRWGVVAYANSLDTVGVLGNDLKTLEAVFEQLDEFDPKDPTSLTVATRDRIKENAKKRRLAKRPMRFGIPRQAITAELTQPVRQAWSRTIEHLQENGHTAHAVSLPTTEHALSAYYILAPAEASSNLAKYDGARYGTSVPADALSSGLLYAASRQHGFGDEVRRRILLGSYSLSADAIDNYFIKAQKIRRMMQREFDAVFTLPSLLSPNADSETENEEGVDALICPTSATLPPTIESIENQSPIHSYAGDVLTVPASLAGLPSLSVPVKIDDPSARPTNGPDSVGIQIIAQFGNDEVTLEVGSMLETLR